MTASAPVKALASDLVSSRRRQYWWIVPAILVLALGARLWHLDQKNLWIDEGVSWESARHSLRGVVQMASGDIHPPLYYILLKGWVALTGDSAAYLRGLSVALSLIALVLAYRLAQRWLAPAACAGVLLWLAFSPHMIAYAQEARMYTAAMVAVLAAALLYRTWVRSSFRRTSALAGVVVALTAGLYLHYFVALFIAALWVHLAALSLPFTRPTDAPPRDRVRAAWIQCVLGQVTIAVLYMPWVSTAYTQITNGQSWRQPVTIADLPFHGAVFWKEILLGALYSWPTQLTISAGVATALVGLGCIALAWRAFRSPRVDGDLFLLIAGFVPVTIALVVMPISGQMQLSRYIGYAAPFLAIGAIRGWSSFLRGHVLGATIAIVIACSVVWLEAYYRQPSKDSDFRPISAEIRRNSPALPGKPAATVLVQPWYMKVLIQYDNRDLVLTFPDAPETAAIPKMIDDAIAAGSEGPLWLVIEARWGGFRTFNPAIDPRLKEIDVPGARSQDVRLFAIQR